MSKKAKEAAVDQDGITLVEHELRERVGVAETRAKQIRANIEFGLKEAAALDVEAAKLKTALDALLRGAGRLPTANGGAGGHS